MIDENGRPGRMAGDNTLILKLIAQNEALAADMSDEQLRDEMVELTFQCRDAARLIEQAKTSYQYPSQAFYVFDRILNRRILQAEIARSVD